MCGISGIFGKEISDDFLNSCIENSKYILKNRGPDSFDFKKVEKNGVICQSLLSISNVIGLDNQPFMSKENISTFNGEIYNYLSLKDELIASNHLSREDNGHLSEVAIINSIYN